MAIFPSIAIGVPFFRAFDLIDPDAQAFITAAGITDATQQAAINTFVVSWKAANLWTKTKAIYPNVGGSATSHKFNLKDPRDLDAAYRVVFNGGWTHSAAGAVSNGTNAYADTFINALNNYSSNTITWGSDRTQTSANVQVGLSNLTTYERSGANALALYSSGTTATQSMSSDGISQMSRIDDLNVLVNNNGVKTTKLLAFTNRSNAKFNYGGTAAGFFSAGTWRTVFFAELFTNAEQDTAQTIISTFNTAIGR